MEKQGEKCRRLVLVPWAFQGHINPMLQLGTILRSEGFPITVALPQYYAPNVSTRTDFSFISLFDGLAGRDLSSMTTSGVLSIINSNCEAPLRESLSQIIQEQDPDEKPPCIIFDSLMYFAEAVARQLNLPCFILRPTSATNMRAYHLFPKELLPFEDSKLLDVVPGLDPLRYKDLPSYPTGSDILLRLLEIVSNVRSASGIIYSTVNFLEEESLAHLHQLTKVPQFALGPTHKTVSAPSSSVLAEETSCITWLDKQAPKSVLYVSIGSVAFVSEKELVEMARGLACSKVPFLWVIRPGTVRCKDAMELLPDGFSEDVEERGCIVQWAPQKEVLTHAAVGGFWTHCGWNSTVEGIAEGVPMMCKPSFGDHFVHSRLITHVWRTGLEMEKAMDGKEIGSVIRRLMVEKEGKEIRQRAKDLKEKVELRLQPGGSCYKSLNNLVELIMSC